MKYLKFFFLPILGFLLIVLIFIIWQKNGTNINLNQAAVIKEIQNLNKLETSQFTIEKIIDAQSGGINIFQQFLFGDKILLIAHGEVIAGVDLSKVTSDSVHIEGTKLTLNLPNTQILVSKLDEEKTKVYDRKRGLLAPDNKDLETQVRQAAEKSIVDAACQSGILQNASDNARKQLKTLFNSLGFTEIIVNVKAGSC